jgi:hypothetical protein
MKVQDMIRSTPLEILAFLRGRMPVYHDSNVFFRDIHYGVRAWAELQGERLSYPAGELLAREFTDVMERKGIFVRIDGQTWVIRHEEYKTPRRETAPPKPAAPARPAAAAPAAANPAPAAGA